MLDLFVLREVYLDYMLMGNTCNSYTLGKMTIFLMFASHWSNCKEGCLKNVEMARLLSWWTAQALPLSWVLFPFKPDFAATAFSLVHSLTVVPLTDVLLWKRKMERLCVWWNSSSFRKRTSIWRLGSVSLFFFAEKWRFTLHICFNDWDRKFNYLKQFVL